ncbi:MULTISPECIES: hypothetical protein [Protofrankia]|uniref:Uncharacterized protein n=1 Tax=Protofrankia coriariae TaxID=1562887 RepID=A0ABR5F5A0_9ACTN|nr:MULTISPECIES: hypothetical protein [Protofrankia]KLL11848.1 hypothetical protein FrCorBMG51_08455 [Protofrankia coriariae]ONH34270.1 hypothetical protein BL254_17280 [Protofrankia sp. BMG5.30]
MTGGRRATRDVEQRDARWLDSASAEDIAAAFEAGQLAAIMGGPVPAEITPGRQWSGEDFDAASPEQRAQAQARGDLRDLLGA